MEHSHTVSIFHILEVWNYGVASDDVHTVATDVSIHLVPYRGGLAVWAVDDTRIPGQQGVKNRKIQTGISRCTVLDGDILTAVEGALISAYYTLLGSGRHHQLITHLRENL